MSFSSSIGVIGGSGFYSLNSEGMEGTEKRSQIIETPYSSSPVELFQESIDGRDAWFIHRHGKDHSVPPHKINYRANLWALKEAGVNKVIAVNAVGGVSAQMFPRSIVIPDQIIDYSYGREQTFLDGLSSLDKHIDFTWPYTKRLSTALVNSAAKLSIPLINQATYACTQGPRLETAAEVQKLAKEGVDIVGMTGMPEAALARELAISYCCIALVVNWGAGLTDKEISMTDIQIIMDSGLDNIREIIKAALPELAT